MKKNIQYIFIILVLSLLITPSILMLLNIQLGKNCEKRVPNKFPKFSFSEKYITHFENYFDDNFGYRNLMVNWGSKSKVYLFKSSLHPQNLKYGKSNWFFYNKIDGSIYKSYTNQNLLAPYQLDSLVNNWQIRKDSLAKKGIKYVMAVWPNKATIYPEYLPYTMKLQIKDTLSKTDQIIDYIKQSGSLVSLVDVRGYLTSKKKSNLLYRKNDTHWNALGAFYAYRSFFLQTKDYLGIEPLQLNNFIITYANETESDLLNMLGICKNDVFVNQVPTLTLKKDESNIEVSNGEYKNSIIYRNAECGNKLKVLVFRDSFTDALIPYFKLHFYETHIIWFDYQNSIVNSIKPNIVITSFVERNI